MRTSLYDQHIQAKANVVDFFGWDMPMHYGSQIEEHHIVRESAGIFDVSHMMITDISGADAESWLRYLLTCDVKKFVEVGQSKYCLMLNEQGGIIDDLIVYKMPEGFRLVTNCGTRTRISSWLKEQATAKEMNINIQHRNDLSIVAIQGPTAYTQAFQALFTEFYDDDRYILLNSQFEHVKDMKPFTSRILGDIHISCSGYTGENGLEFMLPHNVAQKLWSALLNTGARPCGLGARDTLRLEAGMSLYGQDMDEDTIPQESRLTWALDYKDPEREFIGSKACQVRKPRFLLKSFILKGRGIPRHGQLIYAKDHIEPCGEVTSGTYSPSLQLGIGFARVPKELDQDLEIGLRKKKQTIQLVKGAFVKQGTPAYTDLSNAESNT